MGATEQKRLESPRHPLPVFRRDTPVKVFMGAGWAKGTVNTSDRDACVVYLTQLRRTTRVKDARNIIPL